MAIARSDVVDAEACVRRLGLPLVVKPVSGRIECRHGPSSSRLQCCRMPWKTPIAQDENILIEAYINGTELTGSVNRQ